VPDCTAVFSTQHSFSFAAKASRETLIARSAVVGVRVRPGVLHHISPHLADLYFHGIGFRWLQRVVKGQAPRRTRKGRQATKTLCARVPPALQLPAVFRSAVGREMHRTRAGRIDLVSKVAVVDHAA
jgi:hypothetical protein